MNNQCSTLGRMELAQLYFPYIQPHSAWKKLRSLFLYALQTLLQIAAYIIADNHHAQLHALSSSVVSAIQRD